MRKAIFLLVWALVAKSRSSGRELREECRCAIRACVTFPYENHLPLSPCGLTLPGCPARLLNEVELPFGTRSRIRPFRVPGARIRGVAQFRRFGACEMKVLEMESERHLQDQDDR